MALLTSVLSVGRAGPGEVHSLHLSHQEIRRHRCAQALDGSDPEGNHRGCKGQHHQ